MGLGKCPDLWAGGMAGVAVADLAMMYEDSAVTLKECSGTFEVPGKPILAHKVEPVPGQGYKRPSKTRLLVSRCSGFAFLPRTADAATSALRP